MRIDSTSPDPRRLVQVKDSLDGEDSRELRDVGGDPERSNIFECSRRIESPRTVVMASESSSRAHLDTSTFSHSPAEIDGEN